MTRYVLRRLGTTLLVCVAIVFFSALGLRAMSGSSGGVLRLLEAASRDTGSFFTGLVRGNLGSVWRAVGRNRVSIPVTTVLLDSYVKSLGLLAVALLLAATLGVGAGMLAAYWEDSPLSLVLLTTSLLGVSLPTFFVALILQVIEITWYNHTGVRLVPVGGFGWDSHLVLPALVLAARPLAQLARITFTALSEVAQQDFVRTAQAKGLHKRLVWHGHILPNASVSILTAIGVSARFSLGSLPVVEYFFGWPGIGATLLGAIRAHQLNLVLGLALALGLTSMLFNLALEVAYRVLDPRLRDLSGQTQVE